MTAALDPVGTHIAELDRALRGPASVKRSMIAEVRDGLVDAVADHRERGLDADRAAAAAVRDFGPVHAVAPLLQEELTARQGRRTAQLLVVAFPALLVTWDGLWMAGKGWTTPPTTVVAGLARAVDVLTVLITAAALGLLVATFRRSPLPRWTTALTGFVAVGGVAGCGGMSLAMNLLNPHLSAGPATLAVVTATTVTAAVVIRSAARSVRFARGYRRSDEGADPQVG